MLSHYSTFLFFITSYFILPLLGFFLFTRKRTLRYLRFFQQDTYYPLRFISWLFRSGSFDKYGSLIATISILLLPVFGIFSLILLFSILMAISYVEQNPIHHGKIKLALTQRAKRILYLSTSITFLLFILLDLSLPNILSLEHQFNFTNYFFPSWILKLILIIQFIPFSIVLANFLLTPYESYIQNKFLAEAKQKISKLNPYIIGITGSYGKTSTKNALAEILNTALAPTFTTPKSYNSLMGIVRIIRENLSPSHKYALIEMGAYHQGSIARLCRLTPPKAGIVTSVGLMHLERHKDEESIYKAKSELAQAIPQDGILVCNGDNPGTRRMTVEYKKNNTYLYGFDNSKNDLNCWASDIVVLENGSSFNINWQNKVYPAETKLNGETSISNLLACFTMACALGANPEYVVAVIGSIKPVDNRLEVKKEGDCFIIHDAFNSNPIGFKDALNKLKQHHAERKILMTPGMIELGSKQFSENQKAAELAGSFCHKAIIVGETNREALRSGLIKGGMKEPDIYLVKSREEAFSTFFSLKKHNDILLIENDLTDTYEIAEKF